MRIQVKKLSQARKKQIAVAGIAGSILMICVAGAVYYIETRKAQNQEQAIVQNKERITATDFASPQSGISNEALWATTEGAKMEDFERRFSELEEKFKQAEQGQGQQPGNALQGPDGLGTPSGISGLDAPGTPPPPPPSGQIPAGAASPGVSPNRIKTLTFDESPAEGTTGTIITDGRSDGTSTVKLSTDFKKAEEWARVNGPRMNIEVMEDGGDISVSSVSRGKFRARDSYIPSGTFFRSVLLGGVDAPTGGDAQNASPHPVLMRVTDFAQMPNRFKYNFRECFVTGQAYGDISAERAYIRLQNLSCVGTDGRAIDMPVRGYVAGEDGKTGVRGTVVTKQGQMLANALLAGVLSGLGQGVSQSFNVTNDTAFGTTTSVGGGDRYKSGVAQGLGNAADRLAQYYIKLADKVFPVIEVNAGRTVDIVLTQGIEIDTNETK